MGFTNIPILQMRTWRHREVQGFAEGTQPEAVEPGLDPDVLVAESVLIVVTVLTLISLPSFQILILGLPRRMKLMGWGGCP